MENYHSQLSKLSQYLNLRIIGQENLVTRLLLAILCDGHLLVEGAPGLAKTRAIKELSQALACDFHRIQFTPDLLPSDLTGTDIFHPENSSFVFEPGPLFHNLVLADEINRAPAKVQSALLEAMGEGQITIGSKTYKLPELFLVMATQNPIEQEGTYPLPEAQLDRFLLYVKIGYPKASAEKSILELSRREASSLAKTTNELKISQETILSARQAVLKVHTSKALEDYIIQLILATRKPQDPKLKRWLSFGASPRGTIALDRCAKAYAWLNNRDFVTPSDIHEVIFDVLRHRILLNFEAQAEGITSDDVIQILLQTIAVP